MSTPLWSEVEVGTSLPALSVPVERATLVRYAGASGDFNPIHWNQDFATSVGLPDVIAHGMFTMGHMAAAVVAWAGEADAIEGMADAAAKAGVVNMVNLSYRNVAALQKAAQMVAAGAIGEVRHFEASYLQSWLTQPAWGHWDRESQWLWRLSTKHGSKGVLGDVGIHIVDFATFGAGLDIAEVSARLRVFDKAEGGRIGPYVMDVNDSVVMNVGFSNGALGVVHMSRFATGHANDLNLAIHGTMGAVRIWATADDSTLDVCVGGDVQTQTWRRVSCAAVPGNAARFVAAVRAGINGTPDFRRAAEIQQVLDLCIESDTQGRRLAVQRGSGAA